MPNKYTLELISAPAPGPGCGESAAEVKFCIHGKLVAE